MFGKTATENVLPLGMGVDRGTPTGGPFAALAWLEPHAGWSSLCWFSVRRWGALLVENKINVFVLEGEGLV